MLPALAKRNVLFPSNTVKLSLYEHVYVLNIIVASRDQFELKDILVADRPDRRSVRLEDGSFRLRISLVSTSLFATCWLKMLR